MTEYIDYIVQNGVKRYFRVDEAEAKVEALYAADKATWQGEIDEAADSAANAASDARAAVGYLTIVDGAINICYEE